MKHKRNRDLMEFTEKIFDIYNSGKKYKTKRASNFQKKMNLSLEQQTEYLQKHIPYRLNSLMAWDIYFLRRRANEYEEEDKDRKCYWESELLEPAFEISIVFARSLIQFLGLSLRSNKLEYFVSKIEEDVQIWNVIPGKQPYPLSKLGLEEQGLLCNVIKIANKASAHMTTKFSSPEELNSLKPGRELLFKMVMEYVDNLDKTNLWWLNETKNK